MKSEKLFKKIGVILNELQDQYDYLMENQGHCNELEYSLFQANADFLADHAKILYQFKQEESGKTGNSEEEVTPLEEKSIVSPEKEEADVVVPAFEFNLSKSLSEEPVNEPFEFENKKVDELFDRPLSVEEEKIIANKFYTEDQPAPTSAPQPQEQHLTQSTPVVLEEELGPEPFLIQKQEVKIETPKPVEIIQPVLAQAAANKVEDIKTPSLNELFHAQLERKIEESANEKKISDLKQGINLNDKLLYIKDLFNGYNLAYSEAIEVANKLPDFQAADNFFQKNYATQYNWNEKPVTVSKFYDLLRSRF